MIKKSIGHLLLSVSPLGIKERDGQAGLKSMIKKSIGHPLMSVSRLGIKGRDGQA